MKRHECMAAVADQLADALVVATNGLTGTDWLAVAPPALHDRLWRMRTMGLCSSVALGLALTRPQVQVVAFDGDGSILMNASSLTTIGRHRPPNLVHVVFDNGCYEASGGLITHTGAAQAAGRQVDLAGMASAAGVPSVARARTLAEFQEAFGAALRGQVCTFIHALVEAGPAEGARVRPPDEVENKYRFLRAVRELAG
ncbi:MAG TPA: thiamine pyrophosphate-dependent enzyme [Chloroflexota bacterium]|jgi:thiamine pyrophosphate-dependent acetolactate synthase large subunit-like protein